MRVSMLTAVVWLGLLGAPAAAAELQILLPLGRAAYQTNERIDFAVARTDSKPLTAGNLTLTLHGEDGGRLSFTLPVKKAAVEGKQARAIEHLHVNGWLLRPGNYTV